MAITPVSLYFTTPTTTPGYANVAIPSTLDGTTTGTPLTQDQRVLTYALALELLEGTLYSQAYLYLTGLPVPGTTATTITDAVGNVFGPSNNLGVAASDPIAQYIGEFAQVELEHGQALISVLKGNPYASLNIQFAFGLGTAPLNTKVGVAELIYAAELTGVSAYLGAIPSFTQQSPYLQPAASILGTEARHTTAVAIAINAANGGTNPIETAPQYNEGPTFNVGNQGHGMDTPLLPDQILNQGSGSTIVPGALNTPSNGKINPVSGSNGGTVVGLAGTGPGIPTPPITYNGFVFQVTTAQTPV